MKPRIYVCARYSGSSWYEVEANIKRAVAMGAWINETGLGWAVVPHLMGRGIEGTLSPQEWYAFTLDEMRTCDALFSANDHSTGCVDERNEAGVLKIPTIVVSVADVLVDGELVWGEGEQAMASEFLRTVLEQYNSEVNPWMR
jgi:hypothetical protein